MAEIEPMALTVAEVNEAIRLLGANPMPIPPHAQMAPGAYPPGYYPANLPVPVAMPVVYPSDLAALHAEVERRRSREQQDQARAKELLDHYLPTTEIRADHNPWGHPTYRVVGSKGGVYHLDTHGGVIQQVPGGYRPWCLVLRGDEYLPAADYVLAKALLIQADEPLFLKTAK